MAAPKGRAGAALRAKGRASPGPGPAAPRPPHRYTARLADAICRRLADGESLRQICVDPSMPCRESVRRWLRARDNFRRLYAEARRDQADALIDEALDIARAADRESASAARVKVETLRWTASRLAPRKYGESAEREGGEGRPFQVSIVAPGKSPALDKSPAEKPTQKARP